MKRIRNKKITGIAACLLAFVLVFTLGIQGVYAFVTHKTEMTNTITAQSSSVIITENPASGYQIKPGGSQEKEVTFTNTSESAVFIRMSFAATWTDKDGNLLESVPDYAVINLTNAVKTSLQWELKSDGWYYYKQVLAKGKKTAPVMNHVTFASNLPDTYKDGNYTLTFTVEAVQCSDEDAVNTTATTKLFGRAGAITNNAKKTIDPTSKAVTGGDVTWE